MTRTSKEQRGASSPAAVPGVPVTSPSSAERGRARFAAGSRLRRLLVIGGLIAAGWLLGVIFGVFGTAASVAETTPSHDVAGSVLPDRLSVPDLGLPSSSGEAGSHGEDIDGFPTAANDVSVDTEAMAGRTVDGLTSQSKPLLPPPSTADHAPTDQGLAPQSSGGSILFGDVARDVYEPRFTTLPAPLAAVVPPVVRTAADDPSFSPD
ncbi:hypothetical protein GCM10010116_52640 [Microbispora rosea subsp. aerata]|nr:hypothetical protein [Microbispora rosea]GGO26223.1 hypothetical protein GCM10010116_52640 [Microbispora rosea subsp. aerata]GIH58235.1 hypothetical protein Mro02_51490 [Microbispora rosea subsp. aerata]GLJ86991.1 hypothetical protein GCM10017588_57340 [Microbispora rosea subsp. aerata]